MSKKAITLLVVLGLTAGLIIGLAAASSLNDAANTTNTRTMAAAPDAAPAVVETQTPQSCLDALDAAESLTADASDFASTASRYPNLIQRSLLAGYNADTAAIRSITRDIQSITAEVETETAAVDEHGAVFTTNAADCRAGA